MPNGPYVCVCMRAWVCVCSLTKGLQLLKCFPDAKFVCLNFEKELLKLWNLK